MVSLRSGTVLKESNKQVKAAPRKVPPSRKRKAHDAAPPEEGKENVNLAAAAEPKRRKEDPATPPPKPKEQKRTPGRIGPIKRESSSLLPDIKPFKGPPGKKVRKTHYEKEKEYTQFIRENEEHPFYEYVDDYRVDLIANWHNAGSISALTKAPTGLLLTTRLALSSHSKKWLIGWNHRGIAKAP